MLHSSPEKWAQRKQILPFASVQLPEKIDSSKNWSGDSQIENSTYFQFGPETYSKPPFILACDLVIAYPTEKQSVSFNNPSNTLTNSIFGVIKKKNSIFGRIHSPLTSTALNQNHELNSLDLFAETNKVSKLNK